MYQVSNKFSSSDRFIPRRRGVNPDASNYMLKEKPVDNTVLELDSNKNARFVNYAYLKWTKRMYQDRLWSMVAPKSQKVLNFFANSQNQKPPEPQTNKLWPVRPRKKPLIADATIILDMPNLEANLCHHVADWGKNGYLASVFEQEIYIWHPDTKVSHLFTNTGGRVENCVRWNHSATLFATALDRKGLAIWNFKKNQILHESICMCSDECVVTSLQWSSSNILLSGCSKGRLTVWSSKLELLNTVYCAHSGTIITITFSCNDQYLATSATDGLVRIWLWKGLEEHFEIKYPTPVRAVAFHPWKESLFAVGGNIGDGSLSIWNASNHTQIGYKPPLNNQSYCVDCLAWSSLTGELVVSYWQHQERSRSSVSPGKNSIVILSNLETEVDAIEWHTGRVLYLLWSDDGTKLGTVGADENLCVWPFLGNSPETIKSYKAANTKTKFTTKGTENLNLFGKTIR